MSISWAKLKKQIPSRIMIARKKWYDVVWSTNLTNYQGKQLYGATSQDPPVITIQTGMSPKLTVITYLHELAHALSFEYDLDLTEKQIQKLEKSFYYLLKDKNIFK